MANNPKVCVIIAYWIGQSTQTVYRLLDQMMRVDAGTSFDVMIVCNGGDQKPFTLPQRFNALKPAVLNRENLGFNIGAWNHGWLSMPSYEYYLFLQAECFLKQPGWVSEFIFRMEHDPGLGLLGEVIMWDKMSWQYIRAATDRDLGLDWFKGEAIHPLDFYQQYLDQAGVPHGEVGAHLQSLILFTSGKVLKEIGGLLVGKTYREAVACEIGISALVQAKGYRISKVKDEPFHLIGHTQWTRLDRIKRTLRSKVVTFIKQLLCRK